MRNLINGLLLYSRVSNTSEPFVPVNLSIVVQEVLDTLTLQIEKSNSAITVDNLPAIIGDPLQILQLFQNIISNSIKYRNQGIQHAIHIQNQGTFQDRDNQTLAQISIKDNGTGFKPEDSLDIFDIFERLDRGKDIAGTGLGLAICKKIISRHQGNIIATGQPNLGAQFTIQLPAATSDQASPKPQL
jgi:signal transduction histidine kinase